MKRLIKRLSDNSINNRTEAEILEAVLANGDEINALIGVNFDDFDVVFEQNDYICAFDSNSASWELYEK